MMEHNLPGPIPAQSLFGESASAGSNVVLDAAGVAGNIHAVSRISGSFNTALPVGAYIEIKSASTVIWKMYVEEMGPYDWNYERSPLKCVAGETLTGTLVNAAGANATFHLQYI